MVINMAKIENQVELRDVVDQIDASLIRAGEDYVLVHSEADRKTARAALDVARLETVATLLVVHEIWHDGAFHGDHVSYRVVETDAGDEFILVTSRDGEDCLVDADPVNFLMGRAEDWVNCTHHPNRVRDALRDLGAKASDVDEEYVHDDREHDLASEDFWVAIDDEEQPAKFTALVLKADTAQVAWRNCHEGTDDHDVVYLVNAGPHAGQYLRDYASRYEGSSDHEATLHGPDQLPGWARVQLGLEDEDEE